MDDLGGYNSSSVSHNRLPEIRSRSSLANADMLNSSIDSNTNSKKSPSKQRPVYLIGGGYNNHKRNMSHSTLQNVKVGIGEIKETNTNLTQLADYEGKIKNRVQYLEKEEKKMLAKMSIIKKRVDVRENAIKMKQQDQLR